MTCKLRYIDKKKYFQDNLCLIPCDTDKNNLLCKASSITNHPDIDDKDFPSIHETIHNRYKSILKF